MRTFEPKQNQTAGQADSRLARSGTAAAGPAPDAHPLLHLQRTIGNQAVQRSLRAGGAFLAQGGSPPVVQRQPASPPASAAPAPDPGYREQAHAPSFRVRVVAHASPRWRGARGPTDADRRNLALSQQRADAVRLQVENLLAQHLGTDAINVSVDTAVDEQATVEVGTEARGSRDTLPEARGDRSDDARERRRVDVIIESSQRTSGTATISREHRMEPTASRFWRVNVDSQAGASLGAAGSLFVLTLTNEKTGRKMQGRVWAAGGGPRASVGTSASIGGEPTLFSTDDAVNFEDFNDVWVRLTSAGVTVFAGYEQAYLSFIGMGDGAESIDVGGWNLGTLGLGGSVVSGLLTLPGPYPPTFIPIKDSDKAEMPYEWTERGEDRYTVMFETESPTLSNVELAALDSFLASVVASKRSVP